MPNDRIVLTGFQGEPINPQRDPVEGEWIRQGGADFKYYPEVAVDPDEAVKALEVIERQWRNTELLRTDSLIVLPDYPRVKTTTDFIAYREAVVTWDSNPNFPNSELRPVWEDK